MDAPRLDLLRPDQRARLAAIKPKIAAHGRRVTGSKKLGSVTRRPVEASGLSQPGTRLIMETLGFPQFCRLRNCRRAKACLGSKFQCMRDNRELLLNEVLPQVISYVRNAGG
jgi:hypothetical protein